MYSISIQISPCNNRRYFSIAICNLKLHSGQIEFISSYIIQFLRSCKHSQGRWCIRCNRNRPRYFYSKVIKSNLSIRGFQWACFVIGKSTVNISCTITNRCIHAGSGWIKYISFHIRFLRLSWYYNAADITGFRRNNFHWIANLFPLIFYINMSSSFSRTVKAAYHIGCNLRISCTIYQKPAPIPRFFSHVAGSPVVFYLQWSNLRILHPLWQTILWNLPVSSKLPAHVRFGIFHLCLCEKSTCSNGSSSSAYKIPLSTLSITVQHMSA